MLHKWIQHCSELEALHHLACPNPGQTYKNPHLEQLYKLTILTDPVLQPNAAKFCFAGQPVGLPEHITTITNLIQFCHKFVHNSMHFKSPLPLTENETLPEWFELLAKKVIKNSLLEKHLMRPLFEAASSNDEVQVNGISSVQTAATSESKLSPVAEEDAWLIVRLPG